MAKQTSAARMEEVNDLESEPKKAKDMDLVGGLALVTFLALLIGFFLSQQVMNKYFAAGLFGP